MFDITCRICKVYLYMQTNCSKNYVYSLTLFLTLLWKNFGSLSFTLLPQFTEVLHRTSWVTMTARYPGRGAAKEPKSSALDHCAWSLVGGVCAHMLCLIFTKCSAVHYEQTSPLCFHLFRCKFAIQSKAFREQLSSGNPSMNLLGRPLLRRLWDWTHLNAPDRKTAKTTFIEIITLSDDQLMKCIWLATLGCYVFFW